MVFPQSSSEFRFRPEGIREVRIPGTLGRNFFSFFSSSSFFFFFVWIDAFVFGALSQRGRYFGDGIRGGQEEGQDGREKLKSHQRAIIVSSMSPTVPAKVKQFLLPYANDIALSLSSFLRSRSPLFPSPFVLDIAGARVSFTLQTFSNLSLFGMSTSKENQNEIRHASKKNDGLMFFESVGCPRFH